MTHSVVLDDGELSIAFSSVTDNAKVSAIQITPNTGTLPPTSPQSTTPPLLTSFLVNSGGSSFDSDNETEYSWDLLFNGGNTYSTQSLISGTTDDYLYQTERWGYSFSYDVPLDNGVYDIKLMFAEIYHDGPGSRIFSVAIEGNAIIQNLDIWSKVGKNAAYEETHTVELSDGVLNIAFTAAADNAKISAIKIEPSTSRIRRYLRG